MARYYLAYGSNLNMMQMRYRCPDARPVGTAVIDDYELLFKGSKTGSYLTIERKSGGEVPVGVWEVSKTDEHHLDMYEGFPTFYYKKEIEIEMKPLKGRRRKVKAFVYIMREDSELGLPSIRYMQTCREGYKDFGFDERYLIKAYQRSAITQKERNVV